MTGVTAAASDLRFDHAGILSRAMPALATTFARAGVCRYCLGFLLTIGAAPADSAEA